MSETEDAPVFTSEQTGRTYPTEITREDIKPHPIGVGGTELVIQRHGKYNRDKNHPEVGSLTSEAQEEEIIAAKKFFEDFLAQLPEDERDSVVLLVLASDTQYYGGGRRSYETATLAQEAASEVFEKAKIAASNIINLSGDHSLRGGKGPRPTPRLREPQMLNNSPEFRDFLIERYGDLTLDFWIAFEEDTEKETRERMRAEGPDEIANRLLKSIHLLAKYAETYHAKNPGKRLIIWATTHYDTISPFVKRDIFGLGKDAVLKVDYGAGIVVDINKESLATTEIAGTEYPVLIRKSSLAR